MHLQSLKLLRPTVVSRFFYKKIQHLALALRQMSHEMLPNVLYINMACAPENFEVAASNGVEEDAFTLKYII